MARTTRLRISVLGLVLLILVAVSPAYAATIDRLTVTCDKVTISGRTEIAAPFVRIQVALASNLTDTLAKKVVPVWFVSGAAYRATLDFSGRNIADGTLLVISAGEWNGFRYLRPATLVSAVCGGGTGSTPTPTPTAFDLTPTPPTFPPPTYTPTPFDLTPTPPTFPPPTYTPTPFDLTRTPINITPTPPTYTPTAYVPPPTSTPINVTQAPTRTPPPLPTVTRTPLPPPTLTTTPLPPPTLTRTPLPLPTLTRTPFMPTPTQIIVTPSPPYTPIPLPTYTPPY
jgi:hypothetical protein